MERKIDDRISQLIAGEPALTWFGFQVDEAHDGHAIVSSEISANQANAHGFAHGGVLFALADQAFAMAANTLIPFAVTSEAHIQYLAPVRAGDAVRAYAHVTYFEARRAVIDVEVKTSQGVVALFRGTARAGRLLATHTP